MKEKETEKVQVGSTKAKKEHSSPKVQELASLKQLVLFNGELHPFSLRLCQNDIPLLLISSLLPPFILFPKSELQINFDCSSSMLGYHLMTIVSFSLERKIDGKSSSRFDKD